MEEHRLEIAMAKIVRKFFSEVTTGRIEVNQPWEKCSRNSAVCVNAIEWAHRFRTHDSPGPLVPVLSDAIVSVTNVGGFGSGGFGSGVMFFLHVESTRPINVMVTMAYLGECNIPDMDDVTTTVGRMDATPANPITKL